MEAAVLKEYGTPEFGEFPEPVDKPGFEVVEVGAATLNAVDVAIAAGTHVLRPTALPVVSGVEGVGTLADGRRVYFGRSAAPFGSMAQRTLVDGDSLIDLPDTVTDPVAAAVGNAGLAALMPLSWQAGLRPGERVLVLGATGVVGRLAVQAARLLGAGTVVAAGRDVAALADLRELGADTTVRLDEAGLVERFREAAGGGVDVIIDYTWGEPAVAALHAGAVGVRWVQIGDRANGEVVLPSALLRALGATIYGYTPMNAPADTRRAAYLQLVDWAAAGDLRVDFEAVPLREVSQVWHRERSSRRKLVLVP
ncbi:MAG TPA: zinc-binding alcohol dehydrogenase family protein [Pseudonocardiaceae bacterium]|nr:zinc-binding alcohol dehydrogenase family protein [Pseudonocardiaceae bacterium]